MTRFWIPVLVGIAVMLAACTQDAVESPEAQTEPSALPTVATARTPSASVAPAPAARSMTREEILAGIVGGGPFPYRGLMSMEEVVLISSVIARVSLLGTQATVVQDADYPEIWLTLLEFKFRVHEYLKGSGGNEISAFVYLDFWAEETALAASSTVATWHDSRYDGREAIVFLWPDVEGYLPELQADQYYFGRGFMFGLNADGYSVASDTKKLWLPGATAGSGARGGAQGGSSTEKQFMLDVPGASGGASGGKGARRASSSGPTIGLSALKTRIADIEAEANVGGTDEYRACAIKQHEVSRVYSYQIKTYGEPLTERTYSIKSGLPAGAVIYEETNTAPAVGVFRPARYWFEGSDKDVVRTIGLSDFFTKTNRPDRSFYTRQYLTTRPLPKGAYRFFPNGVATDPPCPMENLHVNQTRVDLTVTVSSPRTLHEAFFDPVDIGDAVGADSTNGVLKPNAFSLDGTTTTISSLKWEDGAVAMTLSPTASLADYAVDFIDTTGTTTLSLTSENASSTALAWTVPAKPWAAGDLLMLRLTPHISTDATLSALALSGVDFAFDPANTTYAATVPATTTQTTVTPTTNHGSATYVVKLGGVVDDDGTITLAAGDNVITVDVTAEDGSTTQTYTVTVTRATPTEPVTVTLTPRVEGLRTFVNLTIEWNDPETCDGQYFVALVTSSDYLTNFLGFHPAPETTSLNTELGTSWDFQRFPDRWSVVSCDPSDYSGRRELGRVSLRAAHPDNN